MPEVVVLMLHRADTFLDRRVVISQSTGEPLVPSCSSDREGFRESLSQPSRYGESSVVLYSYLFSLPLPLSLEYGVLGLRLERLKDTHRKRIYTATLKGAMNVTSNHRSFVAFCKFAYCASVCTRTETTWERLRSTSPETPPIKITRLTSPLSSLPSSTPFPSANVEKVSNRSHKIRNHAMDGMDNKPVLNDDPSVTLTIRLIMQGKEVGSIIGKKGEIVKRFREESGAKINISDGSCPERIVTVTGPTNSIFKAFTLICKKFEEWCSQFHDIQGGGAGGGGGVSRPPITLRLIVPASQCGSLIGKGGSKIKEIREVTGASIQVASEMLPNSTERAVTISGTSEAITQCIYHICCVMLESPPKGATIPYRPKPQVGGPVILAGGQAYTIQGNYAVPAHSDVSTVLPLPAPAAGPTPPSLNPQTLTTSPFAAHPSSSAFAASHGHPLLSTAHLTTPHHPLHPSPLHASVAGLADPLLKSGHLQAALPPAHLVADAMGKLGSNPLAGLAALGLGGLATPANTGGLNPAALAALAGSQLRTSNTNRQQPAANNQTHEMTVPNELIGCIIGKGGTKIAEIRQISGAMIRISNCEEREGGATDRTITITGNPDAVALAQYLINMRISMETSGVPMPAYHFIPPDHIVKSPIH
ncbi:poly(rC)-binding protein 4 isoform X4 [Solenopsis invicta]|uniref:poly(rC)-binding protein 4 isoform X4 n=1 Tax=Solenopsis invicta TaxID=13686 RepID=UPI00193D7480|nr:poly(rC)-binding protein 4 isoform X4 [Solenopsis invicta]